MPDIDNELEMLREKLAPKVRSPRSPDEMGSENSELESVSSESSEDSGRFRMSKLDYPLLTQKIVEGILHDQEAIDTLTDAIDLAMQGQYVAPKRPDT